MSGWDGGRRMESCGRTPGWPRPGGSGWPHILFRSHLTGSASRRSRTRGRDRRRAQFGAQPMRYDLTSGTDVGSHALYDPDAVVPIDADTPYPEWERWMRGQERAGRVLHYSDGADGRVRLKVVIDEDFDDVGHRRGPGVEGAVLRVPSGTLCMSGVEYLPAIGGRPPREKMVTRVEVPAGNYQVEAFEVEWDENDGRAERERREMLQAGDSEYARFVNRCACPACVAVMLACLVFNLGMLFLRKAWGWKLTAIGISLGVTLLATWVMHALTHCQRMRRWEEAEAAIERHYPHLVVVLTRLPGDVVPAHFPAGRFGPGHEVEEVAVGAA